MAKARIQENGRVEIKCPGCKSYHYLGITPGTRPCWTFNGDLEKPTFSPSLLQRSGHYVSGQKQPPDCWLCNNAEESEKYNYACGVCHSFIKDGMIQFLTDSTHALAGKTAPLDDV